MKDLKEDKADEIKSSIAIREEKILSFWKKEKIFSKSLEKDSPKGEFIFYDGPPFATGLPHYGHILAGTIKDVIPRYKTMQGFHVPRRWGWDCHGLPVENLIEKELGLSNKKEIEEYGIDAFNQKARNSVLRYAHVWKDSVERFGRFVDMDNEYSTMDTYYTESIWWAFKELYKKGLAYEGFKSMHMCPRCGTTLSNFEVNQGFKDITDISVYVKFKIKAGQRISDLIIGDQDNFYLLAWTTTPWTLPGNSALAVNPNTEYAVFKYKDSTYVLAKDLINKVFSQDKDFSIDKISPQYVNGLSLVGLQYEPVFDYYKNDKSIKNIENGFKVYEGEFVTVTDGTGIVHIAPAFGTDDYNLSLEKNLPFIQHVSFDGKFKKEVIDFPEISVKPKSDKDEKDAHQKTDVLIIKYLALKNLLFAKEKIIHSYPHCWRCDTPLLNYATSSWFIKVSNFKDRLVEVNKTIRWSPSVVGENRFGNWLKDARDWAISRSRYWGAPLPVWKNEKGDEVIIIGSRLELKKHIKSKNRYWVMRHGQSSSNIEGLISVDELAPDHLTMEGINSVKESAQKLKEENINIIITSPFVRTLETGNLVKDVLSLDTKALITDQRLGEFKVGNFSGKKWSEYDALYPLNKDNNDVPEGGDTLSILENKLVDFMEELENKYSDKNILIVTHSLSARLLMAMAMGYNRKEIKRISLEPGKQYFPNSHIEELDYVSFPRNEEGEIDFHRPYIDKIKLKDSKGNDMSRVKDVFDCWFESGAMPFAKTNYIGNKVCKFGEEFEPKSGLLKKSHGYPANFIAEGLDQTRGWFYSMLVLGVALFDSSPYKQVIVNGLILALDGRKMSKSLKNYPDPMSVINKYGVDALRFYLLDSPVVLAEDLRFSEIGVGEVVKKIINRLDNIKSFFDMYVKETISLDTFSSKNVLDLWIMSRLFEIKESVESALEKHELNKATTKISDFIEDLSTWYLRRSRDRFKDNKSIDYKEASETLGYVLIELSKIIAPFMPFISDHIYRSLTTNKESVHLESWPSLKVFEKKILEQMVKAREISSLALLARSEAKITVRQPLNKIIIDIDKFKIDKDFEKIVLEEINVDNIEYEKDVVDGLKLDTEINLELKRRGLEREILRIVQEARKEAKLNPTDNAGLIFCTSEDGKKIVLSMENFLKDNSNSNKISFDDLVVEKTKIDNIEFGVIAQKM